MIQGTGLHFRFLWLLDLAGHFVFDIFRGECAHTKPRHDNVTLSLSNVACNGLLSRIWWFCSWCLPFSIKCQWQMPLQMSDKSQKCSYKWTLFVDYVGHLSIVYFWDVFLTNLHALFISYIARSGIIFVGHHKMVYRYRPHVLRFEYTCLSNLLEKVFPHLPTD